MNVRLKITTPSGDSRTFSHAAAVVRIGRDPACELTLQGEASHLVSREHARIALAANGATIADLGSSNGTLLNDKTLEAPQPLQVGDRIQMGFTGAVLTVLELELPVAEVKPQALGLKFAVAAGVALLALVALAAVLWLRRPTPAGDAPPPGGRPTDADAAAHAAVPTPSSATEPPPRPTPPPTATAQVDEVESQIASYTVAPEWGPSVLLSRRGDGFPWTRLRPDSRVQSLQTLVSLPGYRSHLQIDNGVELTLWGNVPEFCSVPQTLLESAVVLHSPAADRAFDLEVDLDRGRIHLANRKPQGIARIRLGFLKRHWEITLLDGSSEACVELSGMVQPAADRADDRKVPWMISVFTKGRVTLKTHEQQLDLENKSRVRWTTVVGSPFYRDELTELPVWWTKPPDANDPKAGYVMVALKDWDASLRNPGDFLQDCFDRCGGKDALPAERRRDPVFREIGTYFLGSLDNEGIPLLVRLLQDPDSAEVRRAAIHGLRAWLSRGPQNDKFLASLLRTVINPPSEAPLVQRLLYPQDITGGPRRVQQALLAQLDDENITVRELASWHLEALAGAAKKLPKFDAGASAEERRSGVQEWKTFLGDAARPKQ